MCISNNSASLYKEISMVSLDLVKMLNTEQKNTFSIPTRFISADNVQLAYLLDKYYNFGRARKQQKLYRSMYVNSRYEAFQAAVKLIRHNGFINKKKDILILDPEQSLKFLVNPLNEQHEENFLIPGLKFVQEFEALNNKIIQSDSIAGVVLVNSQGCLPVDQCSSFIQLCRRKGIITLWNDWDHVPGQQFSLHLFSELPDLVILGEALTDYEIPFSLFSMTEQVHKIWSSSQTCMYHSSTYGGNRLVVTKALDNLWSNVTFLTKHQEIKQVYDLINSSRENTIKYFAKYINPGMAKLYNLIGYDFICKKGKDSYLTIEDSQGEKMVLDAVSGGGAAITGHCQQDIYRNVLTKHSKEVDYWEKLTTKLEELFGFQHVFPAVSGATAVEIAMIIALLAGGEKKRILVFMGNFAGNTLISLIGTTNPEAHKIFQPLYKNMICIDPFDGQAENNLIAELEKGDIGLVWLEILQGATENEIPENILEVIQNNKEKYGYCIGVDEILMGFYRIGKLASYMDTPLKPDMITFSKAMSDGTFPMASVMVSEIVYQQAKSNNQDLVFRLQNLYKNQFGAHIGFNSIEKLTDPVMVEKIRHTSKIFNEGLLQIQKNSPFLDGIYGKGHIYRLSYKSNMMKIYFNRRALQEENLFIYLDRLIPALTISEDGVNELLKRLEKLYSDSSNSFGWKIKSIFITINILRKMLF